MILCFPDADTFRLAATGTLLPAELTLAPARARFEPDGRIFVESDVKLPKKVAGELARLNVTGAKAMPGPAEELSCWLQGLDAERDDAPALSTQAPVIFEVPDPARLPDLVGEMLRLGNDRQSYCWLRGDGAERVLLRVVGPPYYTLLQSLDPQSAGSERTLTAFVERGPRVWVQMGYRHPVAGRIKLPDDRMLLIRPGRRWTHLDDPPFQDIYSALQFPLPAAQTAWRPVEAPEKLTVPLKLVAGNAADTPEFWVLRAEGASALDAFVRDADDRLLQRLRFAVSEGEGGAEGVIVLRLGPSKLPPPVLALPEAVGFKAYFKLPNLFVPAGTRLHPQLRRDAVRILLANDPDRVVWLTPQSNGEFAPESLAEDAFRPLDQWVDYILESSPEPLKAWLAATQFDFESFVCSDGAPKPRGPDRGPKERGRGKDTDAHSPLQPETAPTSAEANAPARFGAPAATPLDEAGRADGWKLRRQALQEEFLKIEGGLDAPGRQALWPELARANAGAGDPAEAAICWVDAAWERERLDPDSARGWFASEFPHRASPLGPDELDSLLRNPNPDRIEVRQLASAVLMGLCLDPVPEHLLARRSDLRHYLEANDGKLPVRAVWLLATEMATFVGADVLGLARVRDRILQRLLDSGLNAETDLPFFLRTAGLKDSDRVRLVRDRAMALHAGCRKWAEQATIASYAYKARDNSPSLPYIDLLFAFGFAKLGEASAARGLIERVRREAEPHAKGDEKALAKKFLAEAFTFRVEEVLAGKLPARTFPGEFSAAIDALALEGKNVDNSHHKNAHYAIMRLRGQSLVLEPQEKHDRFNKTPFAGDDFLSALRGLSDARDAADLARQVRSLYRGGVGGKEARPLAVVHLLTLHAAMPWAIRGGEAFTLELLNLVPDALRANPAFEAVSELDKKQGELLERSIFLSAHFDRREQVQSLLDRFVELVAAKKPERRFELVNFVAQQCLRSLRRLGLRDEIDKLLGRLFQLVLDGHTLTQLKARMVSKPHEWCRALQTLLSLAGGWLFFGNRDLADPILDEARAELIAPAKPVGTQVGTLIPIDYAKLARSYIAAVGHGPSESGLDRLAELFERMDPKRLTIGGTNARFYSELHLAIVEEVVLAIASDDFALGPGSRRWLDEDEFLVRRRIHRDMQATLAESRL